MIKIKTCSSCKKTKPLSEFHRSKATKDGYVGECKLCRHERYVKRYSREEVRKKQLAQQREKYQTDEEVRIKKKEYTEKYRSDPKVAKRYKKYNQEYNRTAKGKDVQRISHEKNARENPEKIKAKSVVNNAVRRGDLPKITSLRCKNCGKQARNYHHWSYDPKYWLDVIPLCRSCHIALHKEMSQ